MNNLSSVKGRFITVEGTEGVGKSSNIAYIKQYLEDAGIKVLQTREPGGTALSEKIRDLLLTPSDELMAIDTELLLVFAARSQHINSVIKPALEKGIWVLSDRFTDATYAYQGYGRGIDLERIEQLEQFVQQGLKPDLTIFLDAPVEIGLQRAAARGELDRIEQEKKSFFEEVRKGYLNQVRKEPFRFATIDASQRLSHVQLQVSSALKEKLEI